MKGFMRIHIHNTVMEENCLKFNCTVIIFLYASGNAELMSSLSSFRYMLLNQDHVEDTNNSGR